MSPRDELIQRVEGYVEGKADDEILTVPLKDLLALVKLAIIDRDAALAEVERLRAQVARVAGVLDGVDEVTALHNAGRYHRKNPEHRPCESLARAQLAKSIRAIVTIEKVDDAEPEGDCPGHEVITYCDGSCNAPQEQWEVTTPDEVYRKPDEGYDSHPIT